MSGHLWDEPVRRKDAATAGQGFIVAHCDGGSRGNPGPSGYGVVIEDGSGVGLAELSEFLGVKTNNFAEYSGLLAALEYALRHEHRRLRVIADSELMVKQMKGQYRVNSPELRPLYEEAKRRVAGLDRFEIQHVLRGKNKGADRLANLAMDRGTGCTVEQRDGGEQRPSLPERQAAGKSGLHAMPAAAKGRPVLRGFVKDGVVHLLEGALPENSFVKITLE